MNCKYPLFVLPTLLLLFAAQHVDASRTELISKALTGGSGNGRSEKPAISADANTIVFQSTARNLVADKSTSHSDIFLYNRTTKVISRVSLAFDGGEANGSSSNAKISPDGSFIVFSSSASNLVPGDTQGFRDIFIYERSTGNTSRVSINSTGTPANGNCDKPDISGNGRYVVFHSEATNLVGNDTNNRTDVFRHDRQTGNTIRLNLDYWGNEAVNGDSYEPVISSDGRYVAFQSAAVLTPCDTNGGEDIYLRDVQANTTLLASVTNYGCVANGRSYHPSISDNGRFIAFSSHASNLMTPDFSDTNGEQDLYIHDRLNETTERVSIAGNSTEGDQRSLGYGGNISADGRYIAFTSPATTFVSGDFNENYDVFARDRQTRTTTRESVGHYWQEGRGDSSANTAVISADGRYIAFDSISSELVGGDNNSNWDIFLRDYLWPGPLIYSIHPLSGDFHGGTLLTISGKNFQTGAAVTIGGKNALNVVVQNQGNTIVCITPPNDVGSYEVKVVNPNGSSWIYPVGYGFNGYIFRPMSMPWMHILLKN